VNAALAAFLAALSGFIMPSRYSLYVMSSDDSDPTGLMGEGVGEAKRQDCEYGVMNKPWCRDTESAY
jgi:hypothetical protein